MKKLVEADRTLAERIRDFLQEFIDTIKETLRTLEGEASWKQMQSIRQDTELLSAIADMFDAALGEMHGNRNDLEADMKYSVNPTFEREYDAWDGKNENARFFVGKTSQTLRYIGVKNQEIVWDASKIIKVKRDHPAMTDEIIKQVPSVIEDPIIVMESKTVPGRITMFGELADADGAPVLVALELEPTKDHRLNMEVIKIASAYGKDTSPQKLLDESRVLFVDPNKNRTQTWLKLYKLQLPSSAKYGLNGRVTYRNASVNPSIRKNVQEDAKDGGGARFSIRDNMTEAERFDELKDAELSVATYDADASKLTRAEVARLENATRREARQYVKTLYEKFGLGEKRYENPSVKIEFDFPYKGFSKSVHEQAARGNEYGSFGEMLACFDKIVENAIPLESHTDKYAGTKREDSDLRRVYVLVSAFETNGIVPVQLEVKEFIEKDNSLYVAVALHKVKDAVLATENVSTETPARAVRISTISLRDLFTNINPADGEFLKYVPDGFLNTEQRYAKQEALAREERKVDGLRFSAKDRADIVNYTEKQYNKFGWARVNGIISAKENWTFYKRLSDKRIGAEFPRTSDGKYIFSVGDLFGVNNVLIVSDGNQANPSIEKVYRIAFDNETDIDIVRREVYE